MWYRTPGSPGVDLARGKFGHIDAGFDSSASAHAGQVTGFQKFGDRIQHIKIDHSDQVDALLAGQPGQGGRRVAVGVERKEGMAVHIGHALGRWRSRALFHQALQGSLPATKVEMVESSFQFQILLHAASWSFLTAAGTESGQSILFSLTWMCGVGKVQTKSGAGNSRLDPALSQSGSPCSPTPSSSARCSNGAFN
jgi:hypothetical protein